MKKVTLLSAFFCLICCSLFAQQKIEGHWGKQYLNVAYSTAATDDGGYIMTGLTKNGLADAYGDIVVIKTDAHADTLWTFTYGGPLLEGGNNVIQTADGGYLVSGHTEDFGALDCDAFLMKLDKNGNHEWFKVYGGFNDDISEGAIQLSDGGYVFAGITASWGNPPTDSESRHVYFVRTNSTGDTTWTKYYAGPVAEYAYSIASMPQGGFLAVGWSLSYGNGEYDGYLFRLKDNGDTLWTRLYQKVGDTRYYSIKPTMDNGYIIAGYTSLNKTSKPQGLIIKLDADGNELWEKIYGNTTDDIIFQDVAQLPNGNFMFTGVSYAYDTTGNAYILTTDANGVKITDQVCGGAGSYADGIAVQGNDSYLIAGATQQYGDTYGTLYYMEMDYTNSGILGVNLALPRIFPNPVKNTASIILPETEANQSTHVDVMSVDGRLVYSQDNIMAKNIVIYRNSLPSGTYLVRIACKDGNVYKSKFVAD